MNADWLLQLITKVSFAQTMVIYGIVIAIGIWMGRLKLAGK